MTRTLGEARALKPCDLCREPKPLDAYTANHRTLDGYSKRCRTCTGIPTGFICLCPEPVQAWGNACRCGYPIVALMHDQAHGVMDRKWPGWRQQQVTLLGGRVLEGVGA